MVHDLATPFNGPSAVGHPPAGHQPGSPPEQSMIGGGDGPPPGTPEAAPAPGPSVDAVIGERVDAIGEGCSPAALSEHVRGLCQALVEMRASAIVTNAGLDRLNQRLAQLKRTRLGKRDWAAALREAAASHALNHPSEEAGAAADGPQVAVGDAIPGAPGPSLALVPARWKLLPKGVYRAGRDEDIEILSVPLVITGRLVDGGDRTESLKLVWSRDGQWKEHVCGRQEVADKRLITDLAAFGLPVTSLNADMVIAYLAEYEAWNIGLLPRTRVSRQLGWADEAASGFLWGRTLIGGDGTVVDGPPPFNPLQPAPAPGQVVFRGADAGDEQAAAGYHARGTLEGWRATVEPALKYPVVRLAVLASLGAPLLQLLGGQGARNFTVDLCGETSKGKTTTLRVSASSWGMPDESSQMSVMTTWNTTRVGAERRAGLVNGLPTFRDDTKLARRTEEIAQLLFDVAAGRSKDRGSIKGLDRTSSFTTIMLTTGESRAVSFSGDGGTRGRVLTLWGPPFGGADAQTAELVGRLNVGVLRDYGHAGPKLVGYLLKNRPQWPTWQERYARLKDDYLARAQGNAVIGRLGDAFAVITLAGELAAVALEMDCLKESPIEDLWGTLTDEAAGGDRATAALRFVWDYACANRHVFDSDRPCYYSPSSNRDDRDQPPNGWAGIWSRHGTWAFIGFIPHRLSALLRDAGHDADATVSAWKGRGWLLIDPSDKTKKHHQVTIAGTRPRVIAVKRQAFREAGCLPEDSDQALHLTDATLAFLTAVQNPAPTIGDPEALARAVRAVQEWHGTLAPTAPRPAAPGGG
jgi:hypothetical protein